MMSAATSATDIATREPPKLHMSYEEFLRWSGEDKHVEWVNGEVIEFMPPLKPHQKLSGFLFSLLQFFVKVFNLGEVLEAPFEVRLTPEGPSREPDVIFISNTHLDRLTDERFNGGPDLVIEIVSADSVTRDRVEKFDEYEAAGVREYWIIDSRPNRHRAEFFRLDAKGVFQPAPVDIDGTFRSEVLLGFWLHTAWLWESDPDPLKALVEIIGVERMTEIVRALGAKAS
jgi:Uma2 family endonuclease